MPTAPLTAERSALKAALEHYAEAEAYVQKIHAARINSFQVGSAEEITACERNLVAARRAETTRILSNLRDEAAPPALSVAEAEEALAAAKRTRIAAEEARDQLLVDLENAEHALRIAAGLRSRAIAEVLRADPGVADLVARFTAAQQRFADLLKLAQLLPIAFTVRDVNDAATGRGIAEFRVALTGLETDPATPLPSLDALFADDDAKAA
jgi:hypothetical protein